MLRILEAGVLRTTAEWVLNTDSDRQALLSVCVRVWRLLLLFCHIKTVLTCDVTQQVVR